MSARARPEERSGDPSPGWKVVRHSSLGECHDMSLTASCVNRCSPDTVEHMFGDEYCRCESCGRRYRYDYSKGHTKKRCNSCRTNSLRLVYRYKARLASLLGGQCEICGYAACLRALTFHHLYPATKRFNIAGGHSRSWASLVDEVQRCALLCANCHIEVEQGVTEVPDAVRVRIDTAVRGVERRVRRAPGRPVRS
jgi:hypothetical protein